MSLKYTVENYSDVELLGRWTNIKGMLYNITGIIMLYKLAILN